MWYRDGEMRNKKASSLEPVNCDDAFKVQLQSRRVNLCRIFRVLFFISPVFHVLVAIERQESTRFCNILPMKRMCLVNKTHISLHLYT